MSPQVTFSFSGLVALAMRDEVPVLDAPDPKWQETGSVTAYLLANTYHVPMMLIPLNALGDDDLGQGYCGFPDHRYLRWSHHEFKPVQNRTDATHHVWCLEGQRLEIPQPRTAVSSFVNGNRPRGDDRHLQYRRPDEIPEPDGDDLRDQDVTWIPEIIKVSRDRSRLKNDAGRWITSVVPDLRGRIQPRVESDVVWNWCERADGGYVQAGPPAYDQVFAHEVAITADVDPALIGLRPHNSRTSPYDIPVVDGMNVSILNFPAGPVRLESADVGGRSVGVAWHFELFYRILGAGTTRLPYKPWGLGPESPMDAFCPPVIIKPGG